MLVYKQIQFDIWFQRFKLQQHLQQPFSYRETRHAKLFVFQLAFVSDAQDNVVKELPSTEQRGLLHLWFEVDREPEE